MIKNEKQFRNTTSLINRLQDSLVELSQLPIPNGKEMIREAQKQALKAQIVQFEEQVEAYLAIKTHKKKPASLKMVQDLPNLLIQWRIYEGLTQKQLAEKLGWHYQQLQDYEKSDYSSATWHTIKKVVNALNDNQNQDRANFV
jgi:ribosome-binding protein aMBF1 (putative translation factor)